MPALLVGSVVTCTRTACLFGVAPSLVYTNHWLTMVARWHNGYSVGLAINRSQVQILLRAMLRNNLGQVVHTYVPLLPSSITWYRPKGGDAL